MHVRAVIRTRQQISLFTSHDDGQLQLQIKVSLLIPRLHDDGTVRNGSAWYGTERLSSKVYTLCGIEWFLKSNSVINYNHCQKSK